MSHFHKRLDWRRWEFARKAALDRDGFRCVECGRAGRMEVHHIQPLDRGGMALAYDLLNLKTLCRECHIAKSTTLPRELIGERSAWSAYLKTF